MKARNLVILCFACASLLLATIFSGQARAAGGYWFRSAAATSWCAQENGTSSPVYLDPCSTNSSDEWVTPAAGAGFQIVNAHSNLCLSDTGAGSTAYLTTCVPGDEFQEWTAYSCNITIPGGWWVYANLGGGNLWQSNKSLEVRASGDLNSSHDCWGFIAPS